MEQTNLSRYLMCSFAFVLLYPTAIDLYLVALPQIASDLSASESQLHIAFSIYLAGLASTMIFVGRAADYFGRKPVAMCGAVIFTLASMFAGSAETSDSFLIMRFFQGVGATCCYVVAFAILRDTLDEQKRAKVLSMLNGIICSIPVLAPVVGNLIMIKFPWPVLFIAMAMMGITIGLIACFVLKETLPKKAKRPLLDVSEDTNESLYNHFFISR
ncbi:TPA: MFS transporter, partial [Vibrio parahaemolyticus]|nr:MFS transporter [Vibrio parahaemolyticus]